MCKIVLYPEETGLINNGGNITQGTGNGRIRGGRGSPPHDSSGNHNSRTPLPQEGNKKRRTSQPWQEEGSSSHCQAIVVPKSFKMKNPKIVREATET
ncbi:hypothetical protein TSUD_20960 [Trifolium subterraneum]|uniref:Uncharacterized protein n=1 Tax=Trifolium subterraneum TaxID=3900 RepID=A0A2Z6MUD3_TRISU|nr:hypothetical protein TSUD_20960 [Trifolium subterraneum]